MENLKWFLTKDKPLIIENGDGDWQITEDGSGEFIAALQFEDNKYPGKVFWWIHHCVIENGELCVVGEDSNEVSGWDIKGITYWTKWVEPPKQD